MKTLYLFLAILFVCPVFSQDNYILNQGETNKKEYLSVIAYREVKGKIIVDCHINNKPYSFIVDTGAPVTITRKLFDELNPEVLTKLDVRDQSGLKDSMRVVLLPSIKLGDVTFTNTTALVSESTVLFDCFEVDGLLGSNMLRNSVIQFSSKNKTVTITNSHKYEG